MAWTGATPTAGKQSPLSGCLSQLFSRFYVVPVVMVAVIASNPVLSSLGLLSACADTYEFFYLCRRVQRGMMEPEEPEEPEEPLAVASAWQ